MNFPPGRSLAIAGNIFCSVPTFFCNPAILLRVDQNFVQPSILCMAVQEVSSKKGEEFTCGSWPGEEAQVEEIEVRRKGGGKREARHSGSWCLMLCSGTWCRLCYMRKRTAAGLANSHEFLFIGRDCSFFFSRMRELVALVRSSASLPRATSEVYFHLVPLILQLLNLIRSLNNYIYLYASITGL